MKKKLNIRLFVKKSHFFEKTSFIAFLSISPIKNEIGNLESIFCINRIKNHFVMRLFTLLMLFFTFQLAAQPLRVHPENPHIFQYKNRPYIIIGSGEHYGALMNRKFDYKTYLKTLQNDGVHHTRLFMGAYFEVGDSVFGIKRNTLAPSHDVRVLPWLLDEKTGKYDLKTFNEVYFNRLTAFMQEAQERDVIVEICLFSSYYWKGFWKLSPFYPKNNSNSTVCDDYQKANTFDNGNLMKFQKSYVRELVRVLNGFDNFYFEIQNEPWSDRPDSLGVLNPQILPLDMNSLGNHWKNRIDLADETSIAWQQEVANWIQKAEEDLPKKHLISQNIGNFGFPAPAPIKGVSIMNFHYASPDAVRWNYGKNKVIGFNETGFAGDSNATYRAQAWEFILAGGALFSHLDYSFSPEKPDGTDKYNAPGGGGTVLRRQFAVLNNFLMGFDILKLRPDHEVTNASIGTVRISALSEKGKQYALYMRGKSKSFSLQLELPAGNYRVDWVDVITGKRLSASDFTHLGGSKMLPYPEFLEDVAVSIRAY
jgi:hypothetical protein